MTTIKKSEIVDRALEYLGTEEQWCQNALARDARGGVAHYLSRWAVSRCAEGAIGAAYRDLGLDDIFVDDILDGLFTTFAEQYPKLRVKGLLYKNDLGEPITVADFNDSDLMTYQGVKAAMEKYSAQLKEVGE
jgi:hypothetical protein